MQITPKLFEAHVESWREKLTKSGGRPYRQNWPGRLFHHAPFENAIEILTSGQLLSRNASAAVRRRDVADPAVISTTTAAHSYARLYFRPRTPTQYHIEGIRKPSDLIRPEVHAPIISVFVFDAFAVLSREGARVSDGNMQSSSTTQYDSEEGLYDLDFGSIYHDGAFDQSSAREIIRKRCCQAASSC